MKTARIVGLAMTVLGGIGGGAEARTLDVVASFTVLADVVQQVGGDHVRVKSLVPANGDPHEFEPSPQDAKALRAAAVSFISGAGMEGWFERLVKAAGSKPPVTVSSGIKPRQTMEDGKSVTDPHFWNNAANVVIWVDNIARALSAADPEDAADFTANAARYRQQLLDLHAYAHAKLDPIPVERRKVLTSHDAFGYFQQEYGVTFISPLGMSTDAQASASGVARLIDQIKREQVKVYFIENSNDPRLVNQIAAATGARPGGELYVESLSPPSGPASTYLKMFRNNVDQISAAIDNP